MCLKLLQGQMNSPEYTTGQKQSRCAATTGTTCPGGHIFMKYGIVGNEYIMFSVRSVEGEGVYLQNI